MERDKSDYGIVARAWETSKIYSGSNTVNKFNAIVESDSLRMLGSFVRDPKNGIETSGIDMDSKADDRLQKYNIVRITPSRHLDEIENPLEIYLITDEYGHDIGIYEVTEKGPKFRLSQKIQDRNDKIANEFGETEQEFLKQKYGIDSLEVLVDRLSKGQDFSLSSKEQAKEDILEKYRGPNNSIEEESSKSTSETESEKEAIQKMPADMRGEAVEFAQSRGLKIKDILVVDCAKELASQIDNRENQISPTGGPVILIRASHGGADSLGDDVYVYQNGRVFQTERNDNTLEDLMTQHKDEGHINTAKDGEGKRLKNEIQKILEEAEAEIAELQEMKKIEIAEGENSELIYNNIDNKIAGIIESRDLEIKELARERYPLYPFDEKGIEEVGENIESSNKKIEETASETQGNEEQDDDEYIMNRWDSANPLRPNN